MVHDVMTPEPVRVGDSGTSELAVLLFKLKSSGEYARIGKIINNREIDQSGG